MVVFFAFFNALPEYFTTLWMVKAGSPMDARLWNTARCNMTLR
jgi:Ca2+/Na+ antiporter